MIVAIATALCVAMMAGLFLLDRSRGPERPSVGLWIPVIWLMLAGSRNLSEWLAPKSPSTDRYLEGNPIDRNVQIALLALGLMVLIRRAPQIWAILRANLPILVFIFYCLLSVAWSDFPEVSFKRWTKLVGDLMMVMIVLTERHPVEAIKRLLVRTGFVLIPLSILFIRYYPDLGRRYSRWEGNVSYTGVTTDKNTLGMLCLIVGVGAAWRFLAVFRGRKRRRNLGPYIANGLLIVLVVVLLITVNSATALSCFMLSGILLFATGLFKAARRPLAVNLLALAVVAVPFSALFLNVGTSGLVEGLGRNSTLTGRTILWDAVLRTAGNPLIGTGYESFWLGERVTKVGEITGQEPNEAHNGYLEIYANLGWVGVLLLGTIIVTGYRNVIAAFRADPDVGSLKLAFFVSALAYNFTEAAFKMTHPVWILFLWSILVIPRARVRKAAEVLREEEPAELPVAEKLVVTKRPIPASPFRQQWCISASGMRG